MVRTPTRRKTLASLAPAALLGALLPLAVLAGQDLQLGVEDRTALGLTLYQQDLALVRDTRRLSLGGGEQRVAVTGISGALQPETLLARTVGEAPPLRLLGHEFAYDLLSPRSLLQAFVGREIGVVRTHPQTGAEQIERARVLATREGVVLRFADRIEIEAPGRLVFDDLPPGLREQPTLDLELEAASPGTRELELSYLSGGLGWRADYVALLDPEETSLSLEAWVQLRNQSGADYPQAQVQLLAGSVNRASARGPAPMLMSQRAMAESAERAPVPSEALGAYHLYTLPQPVDLPDGRTVQRALFQAPGVAVTPALELRGGGGAYTGRARAEAQPLAVTRLLELVNSEASGLGRPLPAGILRVYGTDGGGQIQFLGEDRIGHTPADTDLALNLGRAFDVTAERVQTQFAQRPALAPHNRVYESTHRILLRNAGSRPARVRVIENLPGEWEIVESTQRHSRTSAAAAEWLIEVPASGERALEFSARVRL